MGLLLRITRVSIEHEARSKTNTALYDKSSITKELSISSRPLAIKMYPVTPRLSQLLWHFLAIIEFFVQVMYLIMVILSSSCFSNCALVVFNDFFSRYDHVFVWVRSGTPYS